MLDDSPFTAVEDSSEFCDVAAGSDIYQRYEKEKSKVHHVSPNCVIIKKFRTKVS